MATPVLYLFSFCILHCRYNSIHLDQEEEIMKRYVQKWRVPSRSDPSKVYTVSKTADGKYECSCPQWIYRRKECYHITLVKTQKTLDGSNFNEEKVEPLQIVPAMVTQVTKEDNKLLVPLIPIDPTPVHFLATICYDLKKFGVSWGEIRERYHLPPDWTWGRVKEYIQRRGRCIETEESLYSTGFKTVVTWEGV